MIKFGLSKTKEEARLFVLHHSNVILSNLGEVPYQKKTLDWGLSKGQGKRVGDTVKGGMCTLMGNVEYHAVDLSGFNELMVDDHRKVVLCDSFRAARYAGAFNAGCNHLESMWFAVKPNLSSH
ncbi:TPA: hypothetical protein ACN331_002509 [Vibrio parahaemolyticus]